MGYKPTDHIIIKDQRIECLNCGRKLLIPLPISIPVFLAMSKAYVKEHKNCKRAEKLIQ
jgi:hypothetical protein